MDEAHGFAQYESMHAGGFGVDKTHDEVKGFIESENAEREK